MRPELAALLLLAVCGVSCTSLPKPQFRKHKFPADAYVGDVKRPYKALGMVKSRVDFSSLDDKREEDALCKNYYNKAVEDLVKRGKEKGADAVIDVKSVVFLEDGRTETYATPECADDGQEGQILAQGIAIKWKPLDPDPAGGWASSDPATAPTGAQPRPRRRIKLPKGSPGGAEDNRATSPFFTPGVMPKAPTPPPAPVQKPSSHGWVPDITPNP